MSINAHCGSCNRELLQAAGPVQRRLPVSVLVRVRARLRHRRPWRGRPVMAAQAVLVDRAGRARIHDWRPAPA